MGLTGAGVVVVGLVVVVFAAVVVALGVEAGHRSVVLGWVGVVVGVEVGGRPAGASRSLDAELATAIVGRGLGPDALVPSTAQAWIVQSSLASRLGRSRRQA